MLVIRMQRTGRKGHAMFRVVVQDSRRTPTSGKIVAQLGSYDPHTKTVSLNKERAGFYLEHGAQPSDRVARLLKAEGVKLPAWVKLEADKKRVVRNADKRRSTRPAEPEQAPAAEDTTETPAPAEPVETGETPVEKLLEAEQKPDSKDAGDSSEKESETPEAEPQKPAEEPAKEA